MFKQSVTNLLELSKDMIDKWLNTFDTVIIDCDSGLWNAEKKNNEFQKAITFFQNINKQIYFTTSNTSHTQNEICEKLNRRGYNVAPKNIITTAHSAAEYLKSINFNKSAYIIGKRGISHELAEKYIASTGVGPDQIDSGLANYVVEQFWQSDPNIGAVIVGFDEHFNYVKMMKAKRFLNNSECLFIGLNNEKRLTNIAAILPGSLTMIKTIEAISRRQPIIIGKPHAIYMDYLFKPEDDRSRTLVIGDNCKLDMLLGYNCQCQTLLVGTDVDKLAFALECKNSNDKEMKSMAPDLYVPRLSDLMSCAGYMSSDSSEICTSTEMDQK